jgi:hypothetical protein
LSRKRRRTNAPPLIPAAVPSGKHHPIREALAACREVGEGLYSLMEDCWKNEIRRPNAFVGVFRLLWTAITIPWPDHCVTTVSSDTPAEQKRKKRLRKNTPL